MLCKIMVILNTAPSLDLDFVVTTIPVIRAGKWLRKKPRFFRFLKNLKSLKFRFLGFFYFLVKFYTDHIKFHILIFICEFCYILQKML